MFIHYLFDDAKKRLSLFERACDEELTRNN